MARHGISISFPEEPVSENWCWCSLGTCSSACWCSGHGLGSLVLMRDHSLLHLLEQWNMFQTGTAPMPMSLRARLGSLVVAWVRKDLGVQLSRDLDATAAYGHRWCGGSFVISTHTILLSPWIAMDIPSLSCVADAYQVVVMIFLPLVTFSLLPWFFLYSWLSWPSYSWAERQSDAHASLVPLGGGGGHPPFQKLGPLWGVFLALKRSSR